MQEYMCLYNETYCITSVLHYMLNIYQATYIRMYKNGYILATFSKTYQIVRIYVLKHK